MRWMGPVPNSVWGWAKYWRRLTRAVQKACERDGVHVPQPDDRADRRPGDRRDRDHGEQQVADGDSGGRAQVAAEATSAGSVRDTVGVPPWVPLPGLQGRPQRV